MDSSTDYIVIGTGIAGLRAAIDLAETGRVRIFTKAQITESNSMYAQGGIAAAIGPSDDIQNHYDDTIASGAGLCDPAAVHVLVEEGPREIEHLLAWGANFETKGNVLALSREGGHSQARVVHGNGGLTGKVVVDALLARVQAHTNVTITPFSLFRDLVTEGSGITGVQIEHDGRVSTYSARATLLATGGGSQVYSQSTNPETATGDGLAAAYRAGATLRDMEFVQFHPTVLNIPRAPRFLLTEALRGEGAHIVDEQGHRFVNELLTRDEVSRAVFRRLASRPNAKVLLDMKPIPAETLRTKFRHVYTTCLQYGLDTTRDNIPITPAAHYFMGGVYTDLNAQTSLQGLYAAGEVASSGVHGANRLASNSLLEALVFGARAAAAMRGDNLVEPRPRSQNAKPQTHGNSSDDEKIRDIAWHYAGIVRSAEELKTGLNLLKNISAGNLLTVARMILETALAREESRGAHFREDFPNPAATAVHSYLTKDQPIALRT